MPRSPRLFQLTARTALVVDAALLWARLAPARGLALAAAVAAVIWGLSSRPARCGPVERLLVVMAACGAFWWGALTLLLEVRVLFASGALALLTVAAIHTALVFARLSGAAAAAGSTTRATNIDRLELYVLVFAAVALASLWAAETLARAVSPLRIYEIVPDDPAAGPCLVRRSDQRLVGRPGCTGHYVHREFPGVEVAINGLGLRDGLDEARPTAAGESSVLVLGDSFAFGLGVRLEATFQERLELTLGEAVAPSPVRVYGAAMPGAGVVEEHGVLEELAPIARPDVVVLELFEGNDLQDTWSHRRGPGEATRGQGATGRPIEPAIRFLAALAGSRFWLASSSLLQLGRIDGRPTRVMEMALEETPPPAIDEMTDALLDELAAVAARCRDRDAELLVLLVPAIVQAEPARFEAFVSRRPGHRFDRTAFHDRLRRRLTEAGLTVVDPLDRLQRENADGRACYYREGHWNERGHAVAAELLAPRVLAALPARLASAESPHR